jgi:hypothetical protein
MPAPRTCRACGSNLSPDVRWCGLCHEPVQEFHARRPVHTDGVVGALRVRPRRSRWHGGPTSLGPLGKVLATRAVLLLGPWGAASVSILLIGPVWVLLAVIVLKEVWRPQKIDPGEAPTRAERFRQDHPLLGAHLDGRLLAIAGACLLVISLLALGTGGRFVVLAVGGTVAVGFLIAWLSGY